MRGLDYGVYDMGSNTGVEMIETVIQEGKGERTMIPGNKPLRVKAFLYIDHCAEGVGWSRPKEGETFTGIPYGWYGENALPFIEVHKDGKLTHTVNCADLSCIEFGEGGR